jgi:HEXXH motif-containing protein
MVPETGDGTLAALARKVHLIAVRRLLMQPAADLPAPLAGAVSRLQTALVPSLKTSPDAVLDAVRNPDVLTHLLMLEGGMRSPAACLEAAAPPLLAGLAAQRGALSESVLWDVPLARLVDARAEWLLDFEPPARALLATASGLEVDVGDGRCVTIPDGSPPAPRRGITPRRPFHALADDHPRLRLSEVDTNPLAMLEEHPEKSGNAVDLAGRDAGAWAAALGEALGLIRTALPTWYAELSVALERVVPVGFHAERHFSASYREAPGVAYLSLHPDPLTLAEAIVHETQHTKLNLLSWLDPVLHNAYACWTSSPVRPDLRPLMGVLLAAHAFVPVAALHRGLAAAGLPVARTDPFTRRRREVLASNARSLAILREKAEPTAAGRRLLEDLERLHLALLGEAPPAPPPSPEASPEP